MITEAFYDGSLEIYCQTIPTSDSSQCWHQLIVIPHSSCDFLVLVMMGSFQAYPGHFVHYIRTLRTITSFISAGIHPVLV